MTMSGDGYRASLRGARAIFMNGARVTDMAAHPMLRPMIDIRAGILDMHGAEGTRDAMTDADGLPVLTRMPRTAQDWHDRRTATDTLLRGSGGIVNRSGEDTLAELWAIRDTLADSATADPALAGNLCAMLDRARAGDLFHVTAQTDPKGDRSRPPLQQQDPGMLLHVIRETSAGIVVRGAKYVTAAVCAHRALVLPSITDWAQDDLTDHALGFLCDLDAPGLTFICRAGFAGRGPAKDHPLSSRLDEVDSLLIFDDVLIPWDAVLFYRDPETAAQVQACQHRYAAFGFVQRLGFLAELLIGTALHSLRQTGLDRLPAVQERLARLAIFAEGINAHLTSAIVLARPGPTGLMMPDPSLLMCGRALATGQLPEMIHLTRELCGGQVALTPDQASFDAPDTGTWLDRYHCAGLRSGTEDRRRLLAFARDLLNSDHAAQQLSYQLFAQSPPHAQMAAAYHAFDWDGPLALVRDAAGLSAAAPSPEATVIPWPRAAAGHDAAG